MATVEVRDARGKVVGKRDLPPALFEAPVSGPLMHQVVVAGQAAQRAGTHSTKTRGQVSGGGRKPWRQKGTGRSRQGSIRSPQWVGGGVAHGPQPRDHSLRINRKMKKAALRSALSDAAASGKIGIIDRLRFEDPRTRNAAELLQTLDLEGIVLVVIAQPDEPTEKSFRNLSQVKVDYARNLATYDVLYADRILFTAEAFDALAERGGPGGGEAEPAIGDEPAGEAPAEGGAS
jgi:large subunit ribosomal protein L4